MNKKARQCRAPPSSTYARLAVVQHEAQEPAQGMSTCMSVCSGRWRSTSGEQRQQLTASGVDAAAWGVSAWRVSRSGASRCRHESFRCSAGAMAT